MTSFLLFSAFATWIIFFDGAKEIEGTVASMLLVDFLAIFLTARLLKAYVAFTWLGMLVCRLSS